MNKKYLKEMLEKLDFKLSYSDEEKNYYENIEQSISISHLLKIEVLNIYSIVDRDTLSPYCAIDLSDFSKEWLLELMGCEE